MLGAFWPLTAGLPAGRGKALSRRSPEDIPNFAIAFG
jgi:hypothetical protein